NEEAIITRDRANRLEGYDEADDAVEKRKFIEQYKENKLRMSRFRAEVSKCIIDYIDYGNAFAMVEFINEVTKDPQTGEDIQGYVGPRLVRISPLDIVFNPTVSRFE